MKNVTFCLLFLLAISTVRADDIAVIRSYLDNKTDNAEVLYKVYLACLSLTRTGTEEAVPVLQQLLDDERFCTVAQTALINIPGGIQRETPALPELPYDAVQLAVILRDGNAENFSTFIFALERDRTPFKVLQRAVLELKSDKTGTIVLDNLSKLPIEKQAALIVNLGARKDSAAIVPRLIEQLKRTPQVIRLAAIEALGEIGDQRAVDSLLHLAGTPAEETADGRQQTAAEGLAKAAKESLKRFTGDEFNKKIITLLNSNDKQLRLAALDIIGERQIDASEKLKPLIGGRDHDIRLATYKAFANTAPPSVNNIEILLGRYNRLGSRGVTSESRHQRELEQTALREAVLTLCRRADDRATAVNFFVTKLRLWANISSRYPRDLNNEVNLYLDGLFQLGGEEAAKAIARAAMWDNDALSNKATELLGRWTTPEVAPYLIEIAEKHPNERYRSRTLRGYLRVVRQMGLPVEQKVQMAEKALVLARTDADKEQAKEVLTRFQTMIKGTPIFDGKTFDGWEILGDANFRIEDGAIVGGSFDGGNPRNGFISTKKEYKDFTLYVECKAIGHGANGGVQFRSTRTPMSDGMIGYQADMTATTQYWGAIFDENRRGLIVEPKKELIESLFRPNDWNEYKIVCKGNNIKLFLNGTLTVDYTETDATIPARGLIGLQIQDGANETWYRSIRIEEDAEQKGTPIFDGKTFDGWEFRNNEEWFRIEDGAIVCGTHDKPIPINQFLLSSKEYGDFTLRIECKVLGQGANGGVHFRSFRTPADSSMPNEMIGYQADMTDTVDYWGAIYDETRRNYFIAEPKRELIESLFRPNDWNEYEIVCRGNNIKLYLNGTLTVEYTEEDAAIPPRGFFALQVHSGPPSEIWYRNIRIEEY